MTLLTLFTRFFDTNKDSFIGREELQAAFNKITDHPLTESELSELMNEICPGASRFKYDQLRTAYLKQS
jgi:Ca2+-binding EF-hand superfamily protein